MGKVLGGRLSGRTVMVTGASGGIGRAACRLLAEEGARLILTSRPGSRLEEAAGEIRALGADITVLSADFSDMESLSALAYRVKERFESLDVLVNNAGQAMSAPLEATDEADWDRIMTVNAKAPYFLTRTLLPLIETSERKTIVNIASVVGHEGYPLQSAYTASKHALAGFSKSLARELQDRGVRIHVLSPGGVATEMVTGVRPDIDTSELIQPEEIAEWIVFLLTRKGKGMVDYVNIRRESRLPW